jgi:hypothetical protein
MVTAVTPSTSNINGRLRCRRHARRPPSRAYRSVAATAPIRAAASLARDAEVGRSTRHPDIKEPAIEIRETLGEPVGTDKEYCLELKTLDVLHVKDTHLALVADDLAFLAARDWNIPFGQQRPNAGDQAIDQAVAVDKDRDRRRLADRILHFPDARG